jgi:hypothetical protein
MGGFFGGDDKEAPPINFTPYTPIDATKSNPPINFMRIFDNVSQQEFVFKKTPKGERYLQLKNLIQQKKDEYNQYTSLNRIFHTEEYRQRYLKSLEKRNDVIKNLEKEASKFARDSGGTEIQINDLSGRIPLDAPFESIIPQIANISNIDTNLPNVRNLQNFNSNLPQIANISNIDTNLPNVRNLQNFNSNLPQIANISNIDTNLPNILKLMPFEMRYAAMVANVSEKLRDLNDTITGLEVSDPMTIERYQPFLKAFREANKLAMDRGFDIKYNGLDNKLREMGLNNSTTALGAMISLQKQKVDTEIENNLKEYAFANNLKQQSIDNLLKTGNTIAQEGELAYKQFAQDSSNQLQIRQQDLGIEDLEQQRARAIQNAQLAQRNQNISLEELRQQRAREQANIELQARNQNLALSQLEQQRAKDIVTNNLAQRNQNISLEELRQQRARFERQSELAKRELTLNMLINRNPFGQGLTHISNNNTNALNAIGATNNAMYQKQSNELQASSLEQERFRNEQAAKSDPFGTILNTGLGAFAGGAGKELGKNLFKK